MGIYGSEIFENDVFADVKSVMDDLLDDGLSLSAATNAVAEEFECEISDEDDAAYVYMAIARAQLDHGKILKKTKAATLEAIDKRVNILRSYEEQTDFISEHIEKLEQFREDIIIEKKSPKKKRSKGVKCSWQVGDTFAKLLNGPEAERYGLKGHYVLLRMVETVTDGLNVLPHVYMSVTNDEKLPQTETEVAQAQYVQMDVRGVYRECLVYWEEQKLKDAELLYIGCFPNIAPPPNETLLSGFDLRWRYSRTLIENLVVNVCNAYAFFVLKQEVNGI